MTVATQTPADVRPLVGAVQQTLTLGASLSLGDAVYLASDGTIKAAKSDAAATADAIGVLVALSSNSGIGKSAGVAGDVGEVVTYGPVSGITGITKGKFCYVDATTAGDIVDTLPAFPNYGKVLGYQQTDSIFFVDPGAGLAVQTPSS